MKWQTARDGATVTVRLSGRLDEAAKNDFMDIRADLGTATNLALDVGELTLINSLGIYHFIQFQRSLPDKVVLRFENCRAVFLSYALMMPTVASDRISSFHASYECNECGNETERFTLRADTRAALTPVACDTCRTPTARPTPFLEEVVEFLTESGS